MTGPNLNLSVTAASAVASFEALTGAAKGLAEALLAVKAAGAGGISVTQTIRQEAGAASQEVATALGRIEALLSTHTGRMEAMEKTSLTARRTTKKAAQAQEVKDTEEALAAQVVASEVAYGKMTRLPLKQMVIGGEINAVQGAVGGSLLGAENQFGYNQMMRQQQLAALRAGQAIETSFVVQSFKQDAERLASTEAVAAAKVLADGRAAKLREGIEANFVMQSLRQDAERVVSSELAAKAQIALAAKVAAAQVTAAAVGAGAAGASAASTAAAGGYGRSFTRGVAGAANLNMLTYGSSIPTVVAGFAVAAVLKDSISAGAEFEKEMAMVQIASDDSAESIKRLGQSVLDLGGKTMFAPDEMAKGLRIITQAGYTSQEAFNALLPVMNMAAIGEITVAEAADTAQKMMHAFGLEIADVSIVGDVMTKVANISATNVKEMSAAMKQASTVAKQYNVDIYEMTALLGVLAKVGITGSAGGTALMNMLRGMYDPTSTRAQRAIRDIQSVSPGFQPRDAAGNPQDIVLMMQGLATAAQKLDPGSFNRIVTDLMNFRGAKAGINETADAFKDLVKFTDAARDSVGYLQEKTDILTGTTSKKWETFKGAFQASEVEAFRGAAEGLGKGLDDLTAAVTNPKFVSGMTYLLESFAKLLSYSAALIEKGPELARRLPLIGPVLQIQDYLAKAGTAPSAAGLPPAGPVSGPIILQRPDYANMDSADVAAAAAAAKKGPAGARTHLGARNADDESLLRARAAEDDKQFHRDTKLIDDTANYQVQAIDRLLKYRFISEEFASSQIEAINQKRIDDEYAAATTLAYKMQQDADRLFRHDQGDKYKLSQTKANDAWATAEDLARKSDAATAKRETDIAGSRADRARASAAEIGGIESEMNAARNKDALAMTEARIKIESAVQPAEVGIALEAKKQAESVYLAADMRSKLQKLRDQTAGKVADSPEVNKERLAALDAEISKLPELSELRTKLQELRDKAAVGMAEDSAKDTKRLAALDAEIARLPVLVDELAKVKEAQALSNRERERDPVYGVRKALTAYVDAAGDYGAQASAAVTRGFKSMEDALVNFAMTGKMDFKSLANSIISDMVRMQVQASITKPLATIGQGLLNKWFGPADTAGMSNGSFGSYTGAPGGAALGGTFSSSSISALSGGIYNRPTYFQFANGGVLGEAGYEAVMPLTRGSNGKLGVQAGGVAPNVIINITNASGQPVAAKQSGPAQFDGENYIVGVVLSAVENNPRVRNALAGAMR